MPSDFSRNAYRQRAKEDEKKGNRKVRERKNESVGMISLETLGDTIENARGGSEKERERERAKL
jgi:hypothetical protein